MREIAKHEHRHAVELLNRRTLRSPIDGVVMDRLLNPGDLAEAGTSRKPILKLVQVAPLRVEVVLPLEAYGKLKPNTVAEVMPEGLGAAYSATVTVIDSVFDSASGTFGVRLDAAQHQGQPAGRHPLPGRFPGAARPRDQGQAAAQGWRGAMSAPGLAPQPLHAHAEAVVAAMATMPSTMSMASMMVEAESSGSLYSMAQHTKDGEEKSDDLSRPASPRSSSAAVERSHSSVEKVEAGNAFGKTSAGLPATMVDNFLRPSSASSLKRPTPSMAKPASEPALAPPSDALNFPALGAAAKASTPAPMIGPAKGAWTKAPPSLVKSASSDTPLSHTPSRTPSAGTPSLKPSTPPSSSYSSMSAMSLSLMSACDDLGSMTPPDSCISSKNSPRGSSAARGRAQGLGEVVRHGAARGGRGAGGAGARRRLAD